MIANLWCDIEVFLLTFKGQSLVKGPGGLLQLCVLAGGHLWGSWGQQVGVGVWLDGRNRRIVGVRLHRQEGATRLCAGDFDSPLVDRLTMTGRRGSLGVVAIAEQMGLRSDWLPAVGVLVLLLLLFSPHVNQQGFAVHRSSSSSSSFSSPIQVSVTHSHLSLCSSVPVYPQSSLLQPAFLLWRVDMVQEMIWAVAVTSCFDSSLHWRRMRRAGGVLRTREGMMEGRGMCRRNREGPVGLERLWMVEPKRRDERIISDFRLLQELANS